MERRRALIAIAALFAWLIPTTTVFASHNILSDSADTATIDEAPPAPPPGGKRPEGENSGDVEALKEQLKKATAGSPAWWGSAHKLLDKLSAADAKTFANTLDAGGKDRLNALVDARGNTDVAALRKAANTGSGPTREAAQQEIYNRMQDPLAKLTSTLFGSRIERAIRDVGKLAKAGAEDAGKYIASQMMRTIGKAVEIPALLKQVEKLLAQSSDELKKQKLDEKTLKWFAGDAKVALQFADGAKTDTSKLKTETPQEKAFAEEYKKALGENEEFWKRVAVKNDKTRSKEERDAASTWLKDNYFTDDETKEGVADSIARSDKNKNDGAGVDILKAFGRELPDGSYVWDGMNTNVALGDKGKNQVLSFGKTDAQIRAAIAAVANQNAKDHDVTAGMDPGSTNGFHLMTPNSDSAKADGVVRRFAKKGEDGRPKLEVRTEPGWPTDGLAEQGIEVPNILPVVPTPTPTPTPTPGGPGALEGDATRGAALKITRCDVCHGGAVAPISSNAEAVRKMGLNMPQLRAPGPTTALTPQERADLLRFFNSP